MALSAGTLRGVNRHGKRVTYTRADRIILAIVDLMECDDFDNQAEPGDRALLDRAADAARAIRNRQTPPPQEDAMTNMRTFELQLSTGERVRWAGIADDGHDAARQYLTDHPLYEVVGFTEQDS